MNIEGIKIELDIESICKVICNNDHCIHNRIKNGEFSCNLKHIWIDREGKCGEYKLYREHELNEQ